MVYNPLIFIVFALLKCLHKASLDRVPQWMVNAVQLHQDFNNDDDHESIESSISSSDSCCVGGPGYYLGRGLERLGEAFWKSITKTIVTKRFELYTEQLLMAAAFSHHLEELGCSEEYLLIVFGSILRQMGGHYRFVKQLTPQK